MTIQHNSEKLERIKMADIQRIDTFICRVIYDCWMMVVVLKAPCWGRLSRSVCLCCLSGERSNSFGGRDCIVMGLGTVPPDLPIITSAKIRWLVLRPRLHLSPSPPQQARYKGPQGIGKWEGRGRGGERPLGAFGRFLSVHARRERISRILYISALVFFPHSYTSRSW